MDNRTAAKIIEIEAAWDRQLEAMQSPQHKEAVAALFQMSGAELGMAALAWAERNQGDGKCPHEATVRP